MGVRTVFFTKKLIKIIFESENISKNVKISLICFHLFFYNQNIQREIIIDRFFI